MRTSTHRAEYGAQAQMLPIHLAIPVVYKHECYQYTLQFPWCTSPNATNTPCNFRGAQARMPLIHLPIPVVHNPESYQYTLQSSWCTSTTATNPPCNPRGVQARLLPIHLAIPAVPKHYPYIFQSLWISTTHKYYPRTVES
jgi:hypothetical protein